MRTGRTATLRLAISFAVTGLLGSLGASRSLAAGCPQPFTLATTSYELGRADVIVPADFDGDGRSDLVLAQGPSVRVVLGDGAGGWRTTWRLDVPVPGFIPDPIVGFFSPSSIAVSDLDRDGVPDVAIAYSLPAGSSGTFFQGYLRVFLGSRSGVLTESFSLGFLQTEEAIGEVGAGDVTGDGIPDLVLHRSVPFIPYFFTEGRLELLRGLGDGRFVADAAAFSAANRVVGAPHVVDVNHDGLSDVIVFGFSSILTYTSLGSGAFSVRSAPTSAPVASAAAGDFDEDGLLDFAVSGGQIAIYRGTRDGTLELTWLHAAAGRFSRVAVADIDQDGHLDVLFTDAIGTGLEVFFGNGVGGIREESGPIAAASGPRSIAAVRVDSDSKPDVVAGRVGPGGSPEGVATLLNSCLGPADATELVVPFIVSADGAGGARFRSEMTLAHRGEASVELTLRYRDAFGGGSGSGLLTLFPGRQVVAGDAFAVLDAAGIALSPAGSRGGTLRISASGGTSRPDVHVLVRTLSDSDGGVAYEGVARDAAFSGRVVVPWLVENETDRTNLALLHAGADGSGDVVLRVTVVPEGAASSAGVTLPEIRLSPGGFLQLNRVLATTAVGAPRGWARVERVSGEAPFLAYAAVNSWGTSDGSFVAAVPEAELSGTTERILPVVVESPAYETELVLTNVSGATRSVRLALVSDAVATPDHAASAEIDVPPGAVVSVPNAVELFRQSAAPGLPARGGLVVGTLVVSAATPGGLDGIVAGTRTSTTGLPRFGLFIPAVARNRASTRAAWLHGLRQDGVARTNLGIANGGAAAARFDIELFDGSTGAKAATLSVEVPPRGFRQLNAPLAPLGVAQGYARVARVGAPGPFVPFAVINAGGAPGIGSGDGSYVAGVSEP